MVRSSYASLCLGLRISSQVLVGLAMGQAAVKWNTPDARGILARVPDWRATWGAAGRLGVVGNGGS
jgi:hypothetical protein